VCIRNSRVIKNEIIVEEQLIGRLEISVIVAALGSFLTTGQVITGII
tara:strand:- start:230 stop:370 length:141 start_codon:yes stop_codon:yes gene_type:complete